MRWYSMSLKTFHIVFIAVSTLVAFFLGVWTIYRGLLGGSHWLIMLAGIAALCGGVGLIYYGVQFIRKLKTAGIY